MLNPSFIMLYVDNPSISADFYEGLLEKKPCESSPTFAMFLLDHGYNLGLWSRHTVEPASMSPGVSGELGFPLPNASEVLALYQDWQKKGLKIVQTPTQMDFGYTFVALDPDGHRLRVYSYGQL